MIGQSPENDFERARQARIADNLRKMQELGLKAAAEALHTGADGGKPRSAVPQPRKRKQFMIEFEIRRSGRLRNLQPETYAEDLLFEKVGIARVDLIDAPRRRRIAVDPAKLAELRDNAARKAGEEAPRGPLDSGKGVRIQGGRVYDSVYGVTCHWCRQKTLEEHVTCTNPDCGEGRKLPVSFCKACLRNRHGEDIEQAEGSGCWVCPPCRGTCGEGCTSCCNCGPCRKKAGLGPTHQVVKEARASGFSNVHDYLVYSKTRESAKVIAARKHAHPWGAWLQVPVTVAEAGEEEAQEAGPAGGEVSIRGEEGRQADHTATTACAAVEDACLELEPQAAAQVLQQGESPAGAGRKQGAAGKVSQYFPASLAKEELDGGDVAAAAKLAEAKLSRKERMKRKLGLASGSAH